ncbi:MAG: MazG nucleotide pyrophosphohydrolase domain-containing protein [Candidatus Woesearchaeota archaeon]
MKEFDDFYSLVQKSINLDPWAKNTKTIGYCKELINEAKEAINAIEKKDIENLKEELADVLYDWLHAVALAEQEYNYKNEDNSDRYNSESNIELKEIINQAKKKLLHRKPYILDNKQVNLEESLRIWKEQKAKEKNHKTL